jgi:cell division septal protein FtsQ
MLVLKGKTKILIFIVIFFFLTTYHLNKEVNLPFLKINKVELSNTSNIEEFIKDRVIEYCLKKSLLNINQNRLKKILLDSKWVKNFSLKKKFPDTVIIKIQEFKPIALFSNKEVFYLINENFDLTNKIVNYKEYEIYPIYSGKFNKNSFLNFYNFLAKFDYLQNINEIKHKTDNQWEIYTKKNLIILFGDYDFTKQFKILNYILNKNKKDYLIDLRVEDRMVISKK